MFLSPVRRLRRFLVQVPRKPVGGGEVVARGQVGGAKRRETATG